ncbi:MAG: hypothetical protein H0Z38_07665 [Firmicutes bacterium]|nr:hypothetical protein [Bacillota bacterium]
MVYSLAEQANAFGLMVVAGLITGLLFDFYRVSRGRFFPAGTLATFVGDLVFSLVGAVVIYTFLILGSWGEFRFHLVLGVLLGLVFYFTIFSRPTLRFLLAVVHFLAKSTRALGVGAKYVYYQGCNFGVRLARKAGLDRLVMRGRKKVGIFRERLNKMKPKMGHKEAKSRRPKGEVRMSHKERPKVSKRFNKTARLISARSKNIIRGLGRGFKFKG